MVTWSTAVTRPSIWMAAGLPEGYQILPAQDVSSVEDDRQLTRLALWRWLVAGFCMMQVMMYATPGYFALPGDIAPDIERLLSWASWVLSLPVVLFSCGPFFSNAWRDLRRGGISMDLPVAIGIAVTFAAGTAATFEPQGWWGHEVYFDSLTMFAFFLLTGRWLEQRLRNQTVGALGALMQRLPATVLRQSPNGEFERVAVRRLVVGDSVRVLSGEAFPADGEILVDATHTDEALLTGESRPVRRGVGDSVMAGSYNLGNSTVVRIDRLGAATRYAQVVALMARASLDKPRLARLADLVAKPFLIGVLLAAAATLAMGWQQDPAHALMAAVAVLIVTCPCALSLATPAAMLTTAGLLARHGVLVRRLQAIESLAEIDTVVFDKTGTLTKNEMRLGAVNTRPDASVNQVLQWAASLAKHSLHPMSQSLVAAVGPSAATSLTQVTQVTELAGGGLEGRFDEPCADAARWVRLGSSTYCELDDGDRHLPDGATGSHVFLSDGQGWLATLCLEETLRPDAVDSIARLKALGLSVLMLSGDTQAATQGVAKQLGGIHAQGNCTPEGKLAQMQALQAKGHKVLMVGDGLNDGPTLAAAHVSVAIGAAVPLAQALSDFVLPSAQLVMLPLMVTQAKATVRIVKQNLAWAVVYNAICIPLAIAGLLPAWLAGLGMALSSLLVVANAARLSQTQNQPRGQPQPYPQPQLQSQSRAAH